MDQQTEHLWNQIFLYLLLIIIILGMTLNLLLIVMFIRHKRLRTGSNVLILNLAVADFFHIVVNGISTFLVFQGLVSFGDIVCKIEESFRLTSVGVSVWSVAALSVHRYKTIVASSVTGNVMKKLAIIFVLIVWIIAMIFALPISTQMKGGFENRCRPTLDQKFLTVYSLSLYSLIPLMIIVVLYILTARRIEESAKAMPGEGIGQEKQKNARVKGAKVLVCLTVVFTLSYLPLLVMIFLNVWIKPFIPRPFLLLGVLCHFISSIANPIALMLSSRLFKTYFKHYFKLMVCGLKLDGIERNVSLLANYVSSLRVSNSNSNKSNATHSNNEEKPEVRDVEI